MKKIIYSYFKSDERRFVVDYLKDKHGWEPVFFHGGEGMRKWVEKCYPDAILHDAMAMRQACFDYSRIGLNEKIKKYTDPKYEMERIAKLLYKSYKAYYEN